MSDGGEVEVDGLRVGPCWVRNVLHEREETAAELARLRAELADMTRFRDDAIAAMGEAQTQATVLRAKNERAARTLAAILTPSPDPAWDGELHPRELVQIEVAEVARLTAIVAAGDALREAIRVRISGKGACDVCGTAEDDRHEDDCPALLYTRARGER